MRILIILLLLVGCAPTAKIKGYDWMNDEVSRATELRIRTQREYKILYEENVSLKKMVKSYQELLAILQRRCGGLNATE